MKATISTIAQMAGVSRGTVDKVLHNRKGVSDAVRKRVSDIINEVGYHSQNHIAQKAHAQKPINLFAILHPLINPYYAEVYKGMQKAFAKYEANSLKITYHIMDDYLPETYIHALQKAQALKVDGVIAQGMIDEEAKDVIEHLWQNGIPTVLYDSDMPDSTRVCFVGENHIKSGYVSGSLLAKTIGRAGEVAAIGGSENFLGHRLRVQGFNEILEKRYPKVTVVEVIETEENNTIAYNKTLALLDKYPELKGIYVVTGCSSGVARAAIDAKRAGEIGIVGHNLTSDVAMMVNLNIVDFAVNLMPQQQGYRSVEALVNYLRDGSTPDGGIIEIPVEIAIAENMEFFLNS